MRCMRQTCCAPGEGSRTLRLDVRVNVRHSLCQLICKFEEKDGLGRVLGQEACQGAVQARGWRRGSVLVRKRGRR